VQKITVPITLKTNKPIGVILAGGRGSRLGGLDKGLLEFNGRKLIELCLANIQPQVSATIISANRNVSVYRQFVDNVVPDISADYHGPLSGIFSVMCYLDQQRRCGDLPPSDLLVVPCDMPFLPGDLVNRFYAARSRFNGGAERAVVAHDGARLQPLCVLLPWSTKPLLENFLQTGQRKALSWIRHIEALTADFSEEVAMFTNVNTLEDIQLITHV